MLASTLGHPDRPTRVLTRASLRPLLLSLALLLAVLLGAGIEMFGHHDHDPLVADGGCVLCRLADAPVDGAPAAPRAPEVRGAVVAFLPLPPALVPSESRVSPAHPLRGPPVA